MVGCSLCDLMLLEKCEGFKVYFVWIQVNYIDVGVIELIVVDGMCYYWVYYNVFDNEVSLFYVLGYVQDVIVLWMQEQQLCEMFFKDLFMQCYNWCYLYWLDELIEECWVCVMFDLDYFKYINDIQGYRCGDVVLVEFVMFLCLLLGKEEMVV